MARGSAVERPRWDQSLRWCKTDFLEVEVERYGLLDDNSILCIEYILCAYLETGLRLPIDIHMLARPTSQSDDVMQVAL